MRGALTVSLRGSPDPQAYVASPLKLKQPSSAAGLFESIDAYREEALRCAVPVCLSSPALPLSTAKIAPLLQRLICVTSGPALLDVIDIPDTSADTEDVVNQ